MAKPIKETPVLTGEDATRFECATNEFVPASNEEKEQAQEAFTFSLQSQHLVYNGKIKEIKS